jgi:hypothetical protein
MEFKCCVPNCDAKTAGFDPFCQHHLQLIPRGNRAWIQTMQATDVRSIVGRTYLEMVTFYADRIDGFENFRYESV